MTTQIQDFPQEIPGLIAGFLDKEELHNLALVSRVMRNASQPHDFREIDFAAGKGILIKNKMRQLIECPRQRPVLSKSVHQLKLQHRENSRFQDITEDEVKQLLLAAKLVKDRLPGNLYNRLIKQLETDFREAETVLLLAMLPNLRELRMNMFHVEEMARCDCDQSQEAGETSQDPVCPHVEGSPLRYTSGLLATFMRVAPMLPQIPSRAAPFSRLTKVVLGSLSADPQAVSEKVTTDCWNISIASHLFQLPCMRSMTVANATSIVDTSVDTYDWACGAGESKIAELALHSCELDTTSLCQILKSCKKLKKLKVHLANGILADNQVPWKPVVNWTHVMSAQESSEESLLCLSLGVAIDGPWAVGLEPTDIRLESLAMFDNLKVVIIADTILLGRIDGQVDLWSRQYRSQNFNVMDLFPQSLKSLTFWSIAPNEQRDAVLRAFAERMAAHGSSLENASYDAPECKITHDELAVLEKDFPSLELKVEIDTEEDGHDQHSFVYIYPEGKPAPAYDLVYY